MSGAGAGDAPGEAALRAALVEAARALDAEGHVPAKSGNLSARLPGREGALGGFLVTPAALPYAAMAPGDIARVASDGAATGPRPPSSEWRLHAAILAARPEAGAVVHTHAPRATALSCARADLPPVHYALSLVGGDGSVRCAAYAAFGTEALARAAVAALAGGRRAALLANHGLVALGGTLAEAAALARVVEAACGYHLDLLAAGLRAAPLRPEEVAAEAAAFARRG